MTLSSVFLAYDNTAKGQKVLQNPTMEQIQGASSVHALAFTSKGDLLVLESEGIFSLEEWDEIHGAGKANCCGSLARSDADMVEEDGDESTNMQYFVRSALQAKVESDLHWKN